MCTRRPLELRLNHLNETTKPWAIFSEEIPGKKFYDMEEVKNNINGLTDKVCGNNKGIVDKPIVLNVYSHTCPDLTLIDLPGITLIPIAGQAENIFGDQHLAVTSQRGADTDRGHCHRFCNQIGGFRIDALEQ